MFTVLGEALLDLVQPAPGAPYVARPGGGPLNIAVGLQRLGHPTELLARVSSRSLGETVRRYADREALGLTHCVATDAPATLAFATLDSQGRAAYDFYVEGTADWGWTGDELALLPPGTRVLHTGSLAAALAPGCQAVLCLVQRLRFAGDVVLSYDPNMRPDLVGPRDEAVIRVEQYVAATHVAKASDEDLGWLYPGRSVDDVLSDWSQAGPSLVVVTRGADGCTARTSTGLEARTPGLAVCVADTIGAGDAFMSGLLSGLADVDCLSPAALQALEAKDLESALQKAIAVSALTCTRAGADPPTRAEYAAYLERL